MRVIGGFIALCFIVARLMPVSAQQGGRPAPSRSQTVGQFTIDFETLDYRITDKGYTLDLRPLPGRKVVAKSARYDLSADRILMDVVKKRTPVRSAQAIGGVTGEARSPERQQVISFSAERADYTAATDAAPARIDLTDKVHFVIRSPQSAPTDPFDSKLKSASIIFNADGTMTGRATGGSISGTPVEPETKKKP